MKSFMKNIKAVILDMDGVLWKSSQPIIDLKTLFDHFNKNGIKYLFATNNAMRTVDQYIEKFASFEVEIEPWQILTSAIATAFVLKKDFPDGGPLYINGAKALTTTLEEYGFYYSKEEPLAVVAGLDPDINYERLANTSLMIQSGLPFYFTNPDVTYPTPNGFYPGAGTFLAALETASGVKAKLAGKPLPFVFEAGLERLGMQPEEVLVVGDRLETDILGGHNAGCKTALVLSGVSSRADLEKWSPQPDHVLDTVMDLFTKDD